MLILARPHMSGAVVLAGRADWRLVSPRGVAIPNVREQLFTAAERVLAREGPSGLTNRAITGEAGCAKGLLYNHFTDMDEFVAELVIDRLRAAAESAAELPSRAGQSTVVENLDAALSMLASSGPMIAGVAVTRPAVSTRVRNALERGSPGFAAIEEAFTAYLDAEQKLGRVAGDADTGALALAITGTMHHLLMTHWAGAPDPHSRMHQLVTTLVGT
jgi:AcrR family transcriptional regulator